MLLFAYTYSKSIDQASNIGEQINPFDPRLSRAISSWDMRHNFVASYSYDLPFERLFGRANQLTEGWSISGTTRFASGFPVTLFDDSDNSLLGTLGNGVNNNLLDTPQFTPGPLEINRNPRNGSPAFNTTLFSTEAFGTLGNARRRFFYGPGINNWDMQLTKNFRLTESKSLDLRIEAFNAFNHAQFYGAGSVDGEVGDKTTSGGSLGTFGTGSQRRRSPPDTGSSEIHLLTQSCAWFGLGWVGLGWLVRFAPSAGGAAEASCEISTGCPFEQNRRS